MRREVLILLVLAAGLLIGGCSGGFLSQGTQGNNWGGTVDSDLKMAPGSLVDTWRLKSGQESTLSLEAYQRDEKLFAKIVEITAGVPAEQRTAFLRALAEVTIIGKVKVQREGRGVTEAIEQAALGNKAALEAATAQVNAMSEAGKGVLLKLIEAAVKP